MYDTKFECRYHRNDVFLESDKVNNYEKTFIRDILYKEDLLNIFLIDYYDEDFDVFTDVITELYSKLKECLLLKECMKKMAAKVLSEDLQTGLCILYSYDSLLSYCRRAAAIIKYWFVDVVAYLGHSRYSTSSICMARFKGQLERGKLCSGDFRR